MKYTYIKSLMEKLNENVSRTDWLNYKTDTQLNDENDTDNAEDIQLTMRIVCDMLGEEDPTKIIFTGSDVQSGYDFRYITDSVIPSSKTIKTDSQKKGDYVEYYTLYEYHGKKFVKLDVKDTLEYSYIFVREDDLLSMNQVDGVPESDNAPE